MGLLKNTASQVVTFCLVNATDGSALTGATVTTKVTKDGTQAASAGTLTELGSGQYKYVPTQGETNAASVGILFTATNAVPVNLHMFTDDYAARDAAVADAVWDEAVDDHLSTLAFGGQWRDFYSDGLYENFRNVVVPNIAGAAWDEALAGHATAGSAGKKLSDISTGTPLDAAGTRAAVGLASANLDTQLDAIPTAAENAAANPALSAAGVRAAVGLASANLDTQLTAIDDFLDTEIAAIKAKTDLIPAEPASRTNITAATGIDITKILGTAISTPATAGMLDVNIVNIGGSAADLGATPGMLDVRLAEVSLGGGIQLRANLGLATADLDTQLAALPTAAEAGAATWEELRASHVAAGSFGEAVANVAGSVGGNVDGNVAGSVGSVVGAVGSVTGLTAANLDVAVSTRLADANTQSQVRAALGVVSANLDAQLGAIDDLIDTEVAAIYSRLGAPAGASMSADIAAVKAETATINTATGAAAIRTAVGLASANLDTQLAAIDDLLDTEIGAIKAKTDLIPASPASTTNITAAAGIALSSGERNTLADAIFDRADGAVSGKTLREALSVILGALSGKASGAGTTTITFRHINDTKDVIVATVDAAGNRTAVTVTP